MKTIVSYCNKVVMDKNGIHIEGDMLNLFLCMIELLDAFREALCENIPEDLAEMMIKQCTEASLKDDEADRLRAIATAVLTLQRELFEREID